MILIPNFPIIDQNPFAVEARIGNLGKLDMVGIETWVEINFDGDYWESGHDYYDIGGFSSMDVTYDVFPNGEPIGTLFDICVYVHHDDDEDLSNNEMCTEAEVGRECWQYVGDDGIARARIAWYYNYYTWAKKMWQPGVTEGASAVWFAVNTVSKGEPGYPFPDPVYDPIQMGVWVDNNSDGNPDTPGDDPAWGEIRTPGDSPSWVISVPPPCSHVGLGGILWAGFRNLNSYPSTREGLQFSYIAGDNNMWYGYRDRWYSYPYYRGGHIRSCLEYPPLIAMSGMSGAV
jgi:hypothetical protein